MLNFLNDFLDNWSPWRLRKTLLKRIEKSVSDFNDAQNELFSTRNELHLCRNEIETLKSERKQLKEGYDERMREMQSLVDSWRNGPFPLRLPANGMTFGEAIDAMKAGKKCYPIDDNGESHWLDDEWIAITETGSITDECGILDDMSDVNTAFGDCKWRIWE